MAARRKVLVVDDEPDVRWALEMILRRNEFDVAKAGSGGQALHYLAKSVCDLILLDAKLGDIDGVELARRIRSGTNCQAPVILVSGYFYKDDSLIVQNLASGLIAAFVTKPFRHDEIMHTIHSVLLSVTGAIAMAQTP
jgi:DNA-binding response OmpR family regulator